MVKYQELIDELGKVLLELENQQAKNKASATHHEAQSMKDSESYRKDFHIYTQAVHKGAYYGLYGAIKKMKTLLNSVKEEQNNEK